MPLATSGLHVSCMVHAALTLSLLQGSALTCLCYDVKARMHWGRGANRDSDQSVGHCDSCLKAVFLLVGSAVVDWLISNNFSASRLEAVTLASMLMEENFIRPIGARSTEAMRSGNLAEQFLDDSTALYLFVSDVTSSSGISPCLVTCLLWGVVKSMWGDHLYVLNGKIYIEGENGFEEQRKDEKLWDF